MQKTNNNEIILTRRGKITAKRQLTIPKDIYEKMDLVDYVEMNLAGKELRIKKVIPDIINKDDYSDLILESVLNDGYVDKHDILKEFKKRKK